MIARDRRLDRGLTLSWSDEDGSLPDRGVERWPPRDGERLAGGAAGGLFVAQGVGDTHARECARGSGRADEHDPRPTPAPFRAFCTTDESCENPVNTGL